MDHNEFWKSNVTVDERLKKVPDMTQGECAMALRLDGTQPTVKAALMRRLRKLNNARKGVTT